MRASPLLALLGALLAWWLVPVHAGTIANEAFLSALEKGDLDGAARLLDRGVDLDVHRRSDGKTLLILAAKEADVVLVRRLVRRRCRRERHHRQRRHGAHVRGDPG